MLQMKQNDSDASVKANFNVAYIILPLLSIDLPD